MNTARDNFYFVEDVMAMLGLSRSKCYKLIQQLNNELEKQGYITVSGRVPKRYYHKRLCCGPEQPEGTPPQQPDSKIIRIGKFA